MGTIGGNIANGSPIGDTPPPLIALGASVVLRKGGERRTMPLEDFFVAYGKQDRGPGEFVEARRGSRAGQGRAFCRLQDHQAAGRGHHRDARRLPSDRSATTARWRRSASPMAAWRRRRSGRASVEAALLGRPWNEATRRSRPGRLCQRFHAAHRHARLGRIPGAGRAQPVAALLRGDQRGERAGADLQASGGVRRSGMNKHAAAEPQGRQDHAAAWPPTSATIRRTSTCRGRRSTSTTCPSRPDAAWLPRPVRRWRMARSLRIDLSAVRAAPGVVDVLTAADVPGENDISPTGRHDEPVLAERQGRIPRPADLRRHRRDAGRGAARLPARQDRVRGIAGHHRHRRARPRRGQTGRRRH